MLVILILSTVALLAAPRFTGTTRALKVSEGARTLIALSRAARARAVTCGRAHALEIDTENGTVCLLPGRDPLSACTEDDNPEVDRESADALSVAIAFPAGVRVVRAESWSGDETLTENQELGEIVTIWFSPDGTADEAEVELASEDDAQIQVIFRIDPLLGRGSLVETALEE